MSHLELKPGRTKTIMRMETHKHDDYQNNGKREPGKVWEKEDVSHEEIQDKHWKETYAYKTLHYPSEAEYDDMMKHYRACCKTLTYDQYLEKKDKETKQPKTKGCCPSMPNPSSILNKEKMARVSSEGRKCTDCYCCFIWFLYFCLWIAISAVCIHFGRPMRLIRGTDYLGNICGVDNTNFGGPNYVNKSKLTFPRMNDDLFEFAAYLGTSVTELNLQVLSIDTLKQMNLTGVCTTGCPAMGDMVCTQELLDLNNGTYPTEDEVLPCYGGDPIAEFAFGMKNAYFEANPYLCSNCWLMSINTTEIFHRCMELVISETGEGTECIFPAGIPADDERCLTLSVNETKLTIKPSRMNPIAVLLGKGFSTVNSWFNDVWNARVPVFVTGIAIALGLGFAWIIILRFLAKCIVWTTIVAILIVAIIGTIWMWLKSGFFPTDEIAGWISGAADFLGFDAAAIIASFATVNGTTTNITIPTELDIFGADDIASAMNSEGLWKFLAVFCTIVTVVLIVLVGVLAKKIMVAIAIIEEASRSIMSMPCLTMVPFFTAVFVTFAGAWFFGVGALLYSINTLTVGDLISLAMNAVDEVANCTELLANATANTTTTMMTTTIAAQSTTIDTTTLASTTAAVLTTLAGSMAGTTTSAVTTSAATTSAATTVSSTTTATENNDNNNGLSEALETAKTWGVEQTCSLIAQLSQHADYGLKTLFAWLHIFGFLWYVQLLMAINICIIAGAVAEWYWTRPSGPNTAAEGEDLQFHDLTDAQYAHDYWDKAGSGDYPVQDVTNKGNGPYGVPGTKVKRPPNTFLESVVKRQWKKNESSPLNCKARCGKMAFFPRKGGNKRSFRLPVLSSAWRTFRYHLGSLAVGSFVIALVQLIRVILAYLDKKTKGWQNKNKCFRIMFKIVQCCMCLLEKCLKFLTKNAFVMIAMRGNAFCQACCNAFKLFLTNLAQFAVVHVFSQIVLWLGKLMIIAACCVIGYVWLTVDPMYTQSETDTFVKNKFVPIILLGIIAYFIAATFLSIYDLAIRTLLMCYCEDVRTHCAVKDAKDEHTYMPHSLRKIAYPHAKVKEPFTHEMVLLEAMDNHESVKGQEDALPSLFYATTICGTKMGKNPKVHAKNPPGDEGVELTAKKHGQSQKLEDVEKDFKDRTLKEKQVVEQEHNKQAAHLKERLQKRKKHHEDDDGEII